MPRPLTPPPPSLERLLMTAAALNEYAEGRSAIVQFLLDAIRASPNRPDIHRILAQAFLRDLEMAAMVDLAPSLFTGQSTVENRVLRKSVVRGLRQYLEERNPACSQLSSSQRS